MAGRSKPKAKPPYRVPRSKIDERFPRTDPLSDVRVGSGEVLSVAADGETMTVQMDDEQVEGVVPLGCPPEVGDWVEVHQRGDLLVSPEAASDWGTVSGGGGIGGGSGNIMAAYRIDAVTWQIRPSTIGPPYLVVEWIGAPPAPVIGIGSAMIGDFFFQLAT